MISSRVLDVLQVPNDHLQRNALRDLTVSELARGRIVHLEAARRERREKADHREITGTTTGVACQAERTMLKGETNACRSERVGSE